MSWRSCSSGGSFLSQYGLVRGDLLQRGDALGRHRMRLHVRVDVLRGEQHLVGETLEGVVHALGRLAGRGRGTSRRRGRPALPAGADRRAASASSCSAAPAAPPRPDCRRRCRCARPPPRRRSRAAWRGSRAVCALASSARSLLRWPPAMWPVSCASTPMIWFGVCDSISAPALTKMRLASTTKALNVRSLMMTTRMFCWARPAARRIGWVYSRSSCSISASRMIGRPLGISCARTGRVAGRERAGGQDRDRARGSHGSGAA